MAQREFLRRAAGLAGLALYNWWVIALFDRRMLPGFNELFSDLEATGQPYARILSRVDISAGMLILIALLLSSPSRVDRRPRILMIGFAIATVIGGLFPYTCAEGIDPACRHAEWMLQLPWQHYIHVVSGIVEFATATATILILRNREKEAPGAGHAARRLMWTMLIAYPLLGVVYLTDRFGVLIEPVFFVSFSSVVALVLLEPTAQSLPADQARPVLSGDPRIN